MAKVLPFKGIRYNTDKIIDLSEVTSPAYDTIVPSLQKELYDKSEYNIVRVDFGIDEENADSDKYTKARNYLDEWIDSGILEKDTEEAFYICEQTYGIDNGIPITIRGIVSRVELEELSKSVVMSCEEITFKMKSDRYNLLKATEMNTSPVYALFPDEDKKLIEYMDEAAASQPQCEFMTCERIRIRLWVIKDKEFNQKVTKAFEDKKLFIVDGHHRYEAALEYRNERRLKDGDYDEKAAYNYTMMYLVPMEDPGIRVWPTFRLIDAGDKFDEIMIVNCLTDEFSVSKIYFTDGDYSEIITERLAGVIDERLFALYTGGDYYYLLKLKDLAFMDGSVPNKSDTYKHLNVTILHTLVLERYFGIMPDTDNESKILYTRDAKDAVDLVKKGDYQCAFFLNPTTLSEIKEISKLGEKIPQRSAYFYPKLVAGIVLNSLKGNG